MKKATMKWWGKIVFGCIGFAVSGPLGLLIGATIGHNLLDKRNFDNWHNKNSSKHFDYNQQNHDSHKDAGDHGELLFQNELKRLKGSVINGYISTENMIFNGQNFEIDFLVMIPSVGIVVAEVKYYGGSVNCSNANTWEQVASNGEAKKPKNASKQVIRTERILKQLLTSNNLTSWPTIPVVVFAHQNAQITQTIDRQPQTDVITLSMFERWIQNLKKDSKIQFKTDEFKKIYSLLKSHEQEYCAAY